MQIITQLENELNNKEDIAISLGYFDGLHIAHQKILQTTENLGMKRAVLTFSNRPTNKISELSSMLQDDNDKARLLELFGIDYLFIIPFSEEFKNLSKEAFVDLLESKLNVKHISVGFNYTFGRNREGNTENLIKILDVKGISYSIVPPLFLNGEVISSTLIRNYIYVAKFELVSELLGRNYTVKIGSLTLVSKNKCKYIYKYDIQKDYAMPLKGTHNIDLLLDDEVVIAKINVDDKNIYIEKEICFDCSKMIIIKFRTGREDI